MALQVRDRSVHIIDLPSTPAKSHVETDGKHVVRLTLIYFDGRGYYLNVQPGYINEETDFGFSITSGKSFLVEQTKRYNAKRLLALAEELLDEIKENPQGGRDTAAALKEICDREGIHLAA